jgi:uncharacterized protein
MEYKFFDAPTVKMLDDGSGAVEGYASTFSNFDSVGERVVKGAFAASLPAFLSDGFVSVGHDWHTLPIATPTDAKEDEHGLYVRASFHSTQAAQDARTVIAERLSRGKSVKLSIGYEVEEDSYVDEGRLLKKVKLYESSYVSVPANPLAGVTAAKEVGGGFDLQHRSVQAALLDYTRRMTDLAELRAKEGRVLSGANRKRIESTLEALHGAASALDELLAATEPQKAITLAETQRAYQEWAQRQAALRALGAYR